ncbi:hypothetical protein FGG12_29200, partial [Cupriavidus campinensis]
VLHNLVSLLRRKRRSADKQYRPRQSRCGQFFNNQTTDKCGRLMANATQTPVCVMLQKLSKCSHSKTCSVSSSDGIESVF